VGSGCATTSRASASHRSGAGEHLISLMGDDSRDCIDCWTSLALAAEWTKKIQFRADGQPDDVSSSCRLARQAASVDVLSKGRAHPRVGAGWNEREHEMSSASRSSPSAERMDLLEQGWSASATRGPNPTPNRRRTRSAPDGGVGEKRALPLVAARGRRMELHANDHEEYRHKRGVINRACKQIDATPSNDPLLGDGQLRHRPRQARVAGSAP